MTALPRFINRKWLPVLIGLIVIAGVALALLRPAEEKQPPLQTAEVTRETISKSVAATGRVVPNFEVEIKGKASGKIIQLPYDVGDYVPEGALLVQLDPIDESREVSQAVASLSGVQSRMDQTRLNLQVARQNLSTDITRAKADLSAAEIRAKEAQSKEQRLATLVQKRYISQEEYETGVTESAQAVSQLHNARVRLQELQTQQVALQAQAKDISIAAADAQAQRVALASSRQRLSETRIYAPISGVVTSRTGQIGQIVASGISNVGGGTAIMTLADLSRIFVLASVDESDIGQVRTGQPVNITADAYPGEIFKGKVVQVAPKGVEESNVVTFEVKIEIEGANKNLLKPQMTANVEILIDRRENALTVPAEALVNQEGKTFVRVLEGGKDQGKPVLQPVRAGINNGSRVEIIQGLQIGDRVVTGQSETQSRWKKEPGSASNTRRGQRAMMRSFGGGRR